MMQFYADLHIHSYYSRATSKHLKLEYLSKWAQLKGIQVVGTGDCIHPGWLAELKEKLEPAEPGLFRLKPEFAAVTHAEIPVACQGQVRFLLTVEISTIYKRFGKVRKVHNVIHFPNFHAAEQVQNRLERIGNIRADGRPILGLDSRDLLEIILESNPLSFLVPAHIWTPWFAILGSKSGFDRIEDCFADLTSHIFAVETGLSSDPPMNWRLQQLDPFILVSNSDAHSPEKLGREANRFDTEFSYPGIYHALSNPDDRGLLGTIEFFPEEGKYHYDGHRKCKLRLTPQETQSLNGTCPSCQAPITVGVMARVDTLADREKGVKAPRWRPYTSLIPLHEILAEALGVGSQSKSVRQRLFRLFDNLGNELSILQDIPLSDIEKTEGDLIMEAIRRVRNGELSISPGYDGQFGSIHIFSESERQGRLRQAHLFSISANDQQSSTIATKIPRASKQGEKTATLSSTLQKQSRGSEKDLTRSQWQAIRHGGSHLLIIAGPGTGKTHTLSHRIASIIEKDEDKKILTLTFSNKAAEELERRLEKRLHPTKMKQLTIGTFHRVCLSYLRRFTTKTDLPLFFRIASIVDIDQTAQNLWPGHTVKQRQTILSEIRQWKNQSPGQEIPDYMHSYNSDLRRHGLIDLDDILWEMLHLLEDGDVQDYFSKNYQAVFVDEYQDINPVQQELLMRWAHNGLHLSAIGDPNQAIYAFRGASPRFFHRFLQDFPEAKTIPLHENFRSATKILDASSQVISKQKVPTATDFVLPPLTATLLESGFLTLYSARNEKMEAIYIANEIERLVGGSSLFSLDSNRIEPNTLEKDYGFGDMAVLFRLHRQKDVFLDAFEVSGIPVQQSGEQAFVMEILALMRLIANRSIQTHALIALLECFIQGFGKSSRIRLMKCLEGIVSLSLKEIKALPDNSFSSRKIAFAIHDFLSELDRLAQRFDHSRWIDGIQSISTLSAFQEQCRKQRSLNEHWQRLIALIRYCNDFDTLLDYLHLQRDEDFIEYHSEKVSLSSFHAAKGLEFPVVFVVGCEKDLLPLNLSGFQSDPEEERRLFYVAMTRAKNRLYLTHTKRRLLFGRVYHPQPSPFLMDIDEQLKQYDEQPRLRRPKIHSQPTLF